MNLSLFPLLPLTAAYAAGLLLYGAVLGWQGLIVCAILAVILFVRRQRSWGIVLLGLIAGVIAGMADAPEIPRGMLDSVSRRYSAHVLERQETDGSQTIVARIDSCSGRPCRDFKARLMIPGILPDIDDTDRITFHAPLAPLSDHRDLPDEVDYTAPLRRRGVVAMAIVPSDSITAVIPQEGPLASIRRTRHDVKRLIAYSPLSPQAGQFLIAAMTGDRELLTPDTRDIFSTSGIAHVLALSGLHVAIIAGVINLLLLPLLLAGRRKLRMGLTIVALWVFAIMTGLTPSVVRATIMATVMLVTMIIERERAPLNALCIAALAILTVTPSAIYSFGFRLSFMSVASILIFYPLLTARRARHPFVRTIHGLVAVSLSATIGTGVLAAYLFGFFPLWFLPVNLIVSFILPALLGCGMLLVILEAIGLHVTILATVIDALYSAVDSTARFFASLPHAYIDTSAMPEGVLWLYFALIILIALWVITRRRVWLLAAVPTLVCGVVAVIVTSRPDYPQSELFVTRSSSGTTLLVREGTRMRGFTTLRPPAIPALSERCHRLYAPYLSHRGVDSIRFESVTSPVTFTLGPHSVMLTTCHTSVPDTLRGPQYLVVCRGFRGDIIRLARAVRPDTILLSADLNRRLHDRWLRELTDSAIPVRSLRPTPLVLR